MSPSQTVGPFFHFALTVDAELGRLAQPETRGERIRLRFRLTDGAGEPVPDAMVEIWQADAAGRYDHPADNQAKEADPAFHGFGRLATDERGECVFETIYPGPVESGGKAQAPHINVAIFSRGLLRHLCTRVYFAGDERLSGDPVMEIVPEERRGTLLARPDGGEWVFEVRMQGEGETVFFEV